MQPSVYDAILPNILLTLTVSTEPIASFFSSSRLTRSSRRTDTSGTACKTFVPKMVTRSRNLRPRCESPCLVQVYKPAAHCAGPSPEPSYWHRKRHPHPHPPGHCNGNHDSHQFSSASSLARHIPRIALPQPCSQGERNRSVDAF
jgi:hypothetical protein